MQRGERKAKKIEQKFDELERRIGSLEDKIKAKEGDEDGMQPKRDEKSENTVKEAKPESTVAEKAEPEAKAEITVEAIDELEDKKFEAEVVNLGESKVGMQPKSEEKSESTVKRAKPESTVAEKAGPEWV